MTTLLARHLHALGMKTSSLLRRGMTASELDELLIDLAIIHRDFCQLGGRPACA